MPSVKCTIMWDQLIRLSDSTQSTLQHQLREVFVTAILDGRIPADQPMPPSRVLAKQLKISRNTVMISYQTLLDDGYIIAKERRGYFVNADMIGRQFTTDVEQVSDKSALLDWTDKIKRRPSALRNIEKPQEWRGYKYPFIYGQPDQSIFPMGQWRDCARQSLNASDIYSSGYDRFDLDDPKFIEQIQTRLLPRRGVWAKSDEILVTVGAQHSLYLIASLLADRSVTIGIETPGYPDALNIFSIMRARIASVRVDEEGIVVDEIPDECSCVFVTPSHQSPTTVTMSVERRKQLLARAKKSDFVVIEDDYEAESNYLGDPIPALKSQDRDNNVIYVGSLSKTLAPGLRMGYMVGPAEFIREARALRRLMIRHTAANNQRTVALFLARGHHDSLVQQINKVYRERWEHTVEALNMYLPNTFSLPTFGGSAFWIRGPYNLNSTELAEVLKKKSVLIEPGSVYFGADSPTSRYFRLGFCAIPSERIRRGVEVISETISKELRKV